MKTIFTSAYMLSNRGCYEKQKMADLVGENKEITIEDFLNWQIPLKDKAWFIRNKCELTDDQLREFAIGCAIVVLPIYEAKNPNNKAPRKAIEAAQAYLRKEITIEVLREARSNAYDAAYAAYDAYDAAYAAYAAYAAAYAKNGAYAKNDAAYAAYAADYAAYAKNGVNYTDLLLEFFKNFVK